MTAGKSLVRCRGGTGTGGRRAAAPGGRAAVASHQAAPVSRCTKFLGMNTVQLQSNSQIANAELAARYSGRALPDCTKCRTVSSATLRSGSRPRASMKQRATTMPALVTHRAGVIPALLAKGGGRLDPARVRAAGTELGIGRTILYCLISLFFAACRPRRRGGGQHWGYRRMTTFAGAVGGTTHRRSPVATPDWVGDGVAVERRIGTPGSTAQVHPEETTTSLPPLRQARPSSGPLWSVSA